MNDQYELIDGVFEQQAEYDTLATLLEAQGKEVMSAEIALVSWMLHNDLSTLDDHDHQVRVTIDGRGLPVFHDLTEDE